jgi:restriction system protein
MNKYATCSLGLNESEEVPVPRRSGLWAEIQRDRARRKRMNQQELRAAEKAAAQAKREADRRRREAARRAATDERERKRLYVEGRNAEAATLTSEVEHRVSILASVLAAGLAEPLNVSFASLKQTYEVPPFNPAGLDKETPTPDWADLAPPPPGLVGRAFGGGRRRRAEAVARADYERRCVEHAAQEDARRRQLEERRRTHAKRAAEAAAETERHNAGVDELERAFRAGDRGAIMHFFALVLDSSRYPEGFPHQTRVIYRDQPRDLVIDFELPPQEVVPLERSFKYVQTRDKIEAQARPLKEIRTTYAHLIAQVALRTLHEVFSLPDAEEIVAEATLNGRVSAVDKATGQKIRPHLISVGTTRDQWSTLVLADLDPQSCLKHLNALVSPHPYDLEAVRPVVDFDALLAQYSFVEGMDAIATLDCRRDLLAMPPTEFEHLSRQLFEAIGMDSWVTQASKDDGVDGVVTNPDPIMGGHCIVQAKRYARAVGVDAIRELAGVMADKRATKGILVTTSWVTKEGHAFAQRNGRIQIIEGENLKYLCHEHLGLDVLISLPRRPRRRDGAG